MISTAGCTGRGSGRTSWPRCRRVWRGSAAVGASRPGTSAWGAPRAPSPPTQPPSGYRRRRPIARCRRQPGAPSTRWPGRPGSPRKRRRSSSPVRVSQRPRPISNGPRSSCATIPADSAVCAARGWSGRHPIFTPPRSSAAGGLAAWTRATFDTPAMWAARLRLAAASGAALERVLAGEPNIPA